MANGDSGDKFARYSNAHKIVDFAKSVISDGVSRGRRIKVGRIKNLFGKRKFRKRGFDNSSPIWLTDDTIIKYTDHPKSRKGATVPIELLPAVSRALSNPKNIYLDDSSKNRRNGNLIYVGTLNHPQYKGKVIKAVVHIDFSRNGEEFHKLKSYGIVDRSNMRDLIYKKIK